MAEEWSTVHPERDGSSGSSADPPARGWAHCCLTLGRDCAQNVQRPWVWTGLREIVSDNEPLDNELCQFGSVDGDLALVLQMEWSC